MQALIKEPAVARGVKTEFPIYSPVAVPALTVNFLWTLTGNATYALCQWAVLMSFAKLGNVEMLGQYSLGLAITAPVFQFCGLQLRAVQVTDARNRYAFREFAGVRLMMTAIALVTVGALGLAGPIRGQTALVVALIGLSKAVESLSDLCQGLFQKNERMDRVAKSLILKGVFAAVVVAITLKLSGGPAFAAGMLTIAWALVWAGYDLRNTIAQLAGGPKTVLPNISRPVFRDLFVLTLPLGFVMMVLSLNANVPRYFLAKYSGEASVGVFAALTYCIVAGNMVMVALGQAASPKLAKLHCDGDLGAFCALVAKLAAFGAATGIVGLMAVKFAGAEILTILYRPAYALHVKPFFWLVAAGGLTNVSAALGVAMTAMQGFKQQAWIHLGCFVVGLVASAVLVPSMGISGAAFSVLILSAALLAGFSLQFGLMIADQRRASTLLVVPR